MGKIGAETSNGEGLNDPGCSMPATTQRDGGCRLLCFAIFLTKTTWFSATAIVPDLSLVWHIRLAQASWLTNTVQLGFVVGALVSALVTRGGCRPKPKSPISQGTVSQRGLPIFLERTAYDRQEDNRRPEAEKIAKPGQPAPPRPLCAVCALGEDGP